MFTWIPIHREAIHKILEYRRNQEGLIEILREMKQSGLKVISLKEKSDENENIPLAEIDPFSFMANFNRGITENNRLENWKFLKERWNLKASVPEDFGGLPVLHNMISWFFPHKKEREKDHMSTLWQLAEAAADGDIAAIDENLFDRCLNFKVIGMGKLTIGLFWINPEKFLPAERKCIAYGKANNIETDPVDCQSYREWMKEMNRVLGDDNAKISNDAHLFVTEDKDSEIESTQNKNWEFTQWMGPLLDALRDLGGSGKPKEVSEKISISLNLPESVITETTKQGQKRFHNQVQWAKKYLMWEGLVESEKRGIWTLTDKGRNTSLDEKQSQTIGEKWAYIHKKTGKDRADNEAVVIRDGLDSEYGVSQKEGAASSMRRYWVLSAGKRGKYWDEFYQNGIMAIGFQGTTDLSQYSNKEEIRKKLAEIAGGDSTRKIDAHTCWQFAHDVKKGDIVFAKRGFTTFLGYGVVEGDYSFDDSRKYFKHVRKVRWLHKGPWEMPKDKKVAPKTLTDITPYSEFVRFLTGRVGLDIHSLPQAAPISPAISSETSYWWLNANPNIWNIKDMQVGQKQIYTSRNERGNKRQKYKYFEKVKPGDIIVGYVTSPQREIVAICKVTRALHQSDEGEGIEFHKVENIENPVPYEMLLSNPGLADSEPVISHQGSLFRLTEDEYEIIRSLIDDTSIPVRSQLEPYDKKNALNGLFLKEDQFDMILDALQEKKNVILQGAPGVGKTYVAQRIAYSLIGSRDDRRVEMIQFHQSYSYEDFIQGYRPTAKGSFDLKYGLFYLFCRRAQREEAKGNPYVFIIDEINRGNLSKIFGELMMLIEPDKRGKEYAIPLTYSQDSEEKFHIPENLYLIGMMNTADRSLAMVDYALRRRFRFITLQPEFSSKVFQQFLIERGAKKELVKKIVNRMTTLNQVISLETRNLGPGYQIGHSYFCPGDDITPDEEWYQRVIKAEIVPLIQEYWFEDEEKVKEQEFNLLQ